ncbi:MAG: LiaF domain-containing protein [Anaerolineaceae bacterium]
MKTRTFGSTKKARLSRILFWVVLAAVLLVLTGSLSGCSVISNMIGGEVLTYPVSEPLGMASSAEFEIYTGSGNLTVDGQADIDMLAGGSLQYQEKWGSPAQTLEMNSSKATFTLTWGERKACTAALEWLVNLNPAVAADLTARSGGGNISLDLTGMNLTSVFTETGGGNVEVTLPEQMSTLNVTAKSGAGNVVVTIPAGAAARIHASTGVGQIIIDPRFVKIDDQTYQSADYETAANRVELTLGSGAGNVEVRSN